MRDIKFRGKTENNIWKYGSLLKDNPQKTYYIVDNEDGSGREVLEETVGQYTGLKDKNAKEIYEGDIVAYIEDGSIGKITWNKEEAGFYISMLLEDGGFEEEMMCDYIRGIEVIGNIYDNPELLEEGK